MIIITTNSSTRYINEGDFLEVRYLKDLSLVCLIPKPGFAERVADHLIRDVVSVSYTDQPAPPSPTHSAAYGMSYREAADHFYVKFQLCRNALKRLADICTTMSDRRFSRKGTRQDLLDVIADCMEQCEKRRLIHKPVTR